MKKWNGSVKSTTFDGIDMIVTEGGLAYRRPTYRWDIPYEEWKDEASCKGVDPQLFELQDPDEISEDDQHELIAWGLKICVDCPVRQSCLINSNEEDRHWSTRGGQPPEGLFPDAKMPKINLAKARRGGFEPGLRTPREKCKHGHNEWMTDARGKRRCVPCRKAQTAKDWEKRKAARLEG